MNTDVSTAFESHFGVLNDPRIKRSKLYPLTEILFVVLCGTICGAESWRDFVLFGREKSEFLRQYFPFEHGIPSKNTYARVFAALNPEAFKTCFIGWVKSLQSILNDVIAIDGKTLCNSINKQNNIPAIHMVSAFATGARLILAENRMWYYLRNRRLSGYKFVRQQAIDNYIVDFVCREKKLIVEVDGGQHMDATEYDEHRTSVLEARGYQVLRVWNHDVFQNTAGIMEKILALLETEPHPSTLIPNPSPKTGEGSSSVRAFNISA